MTFICTLTDPSLLLGILPKSGTADYTYLEEHNLGYLSFGSDAILVTPRLDHNGEWVLTAGRSLALRGVAQTAETIHLYENAAGVLSWATREADMIEAAPIPPVEPTPVIPAAPTREKVVDAPLPGYLIDLLDRADSVLRTSARTFEVQHLYILQPARTLVYMGPKDTVLVRTRKAWGRYREDGQSMPPMTPEQIATVNRLLERSKR